MDSLSFLCLSQMNESPYKYMENTNYLSEHCIDLDLFYSNLEFISPSIHLL